MEELWYATPGRNHEHAYRARNRTRGQGRGRRDHVFFLRAAAHLQKARDIFAAELLASGGLGGMAPEEGPAQQAVQHIFDWLTFGSEASIAIEWLAEEFFRHRIDNHIARAGVEGDDLLGRRARRYGAEVGNSADVLHDASAALVAVEQVVEEGNQRCAQAPGRHVGWTEVGDYRYARTGGNDRTLARLPCARHIAPQVRTKVALVIKRLPVTANQVQLQPRTFRRRVNGVCVQFAEKKVQARQVRYFRRFGIHRRQNRTPDFCRIRRFILR